MDNHNIFEDEEKQEYTGEYQSYGDYNSNPYGPSNDQRQPSKGFGIASLVLGIFSLVFFCSCLNIFTAILAIIFGIIQLSRFKNFGKGLAIGGLVTAIASIILFFAFWGVIFANGNLRDSVMDFSEGDGSMPYNIEEYLEPFMSPDDILPREDIDEFIIEEGQGDAQEL